MKIIPILDQNGLSEAAEAMLQKALKNPEMKNLLDQMVAEPRLDRKSLFVAAFLVGASIAIREAALGAIRELREG